MKIVFGQKLHAEDDYLDAIEAAGFDVIFAGRSTARDWDQMLDTMERLTRRSLDLGPEDERAASTLTEPRAPIRSCVPERRRQKEDSPCPIVPDISPRSDRGGGPRAPGRTRNIALRRSAPPFVGRLHQTSELGAAALSTVRLWMRRLRVSSWFYQSLGLPVIFRLLSFTATPISILDWKPRATCSPPALMSAAIDSDTIEPRTFSARARPGNWDRCLCPHAMPSPLKFSEYLSIWVGSREICYGLYEQDDLVACGLSVVDGQLVGFSTSSPTRPIDARDMLPVL